MKYLENISYTNINEGIKYLKTHTFNYKLQNNETVIYHVYWYGEINRKQICSINSYLKTQDLNNTKLWVWLDYKTYEISKAYTNT